MMSPSLPGMTSPLPAQRQLGHNSSEQFLLELHSRMIMCLSEKHRLAAQMAMLGPRPCFRLTPPVIHLQKAKRPRRGTMRCTCPPAKMLLPGEPAQSLTLGLLTDLRGTTPEPSKTLCCWVDLDLARGPWDSRKNFGRVARMTPPPPAHAPQASPQASIFDLWGRAIIWYVSK